jgi:hypothetical protein
MTLLIIAVGQKATKVRKYRTGAGKAWMITRNAVGMAPTRSDGAGAGCGAGGGSRDMPMSWVAHTAFQKTVAVSVPNDGLGFSLSLC